MTELSITLEERVRAMLADESKWTIYPYRTFWNSNEYSPGWPVFKGFFRETVQEVFMKIDPRIIAVWVGDNWVACDYPPGILIVTDLSA